MTPQQKRVLAAARSFKGTCSADWIDGLGADGKGKISRVPARIEELAELYGCTFECIGWRHRTKVYRLTSEPELTGASDEPRPAAVKERGPASVGTIRQASGVPVSFDSDRLFDPPPETGHWRETAA